MPHRFGATRPPLPHNKVSGRGETPPRKHPVPPPHQMRGGTGCRRRSGERSGILVSLVAELTTVLLLEAQQHRLVLVLVGFLDLLDLGHNVLRVRGEQ